MGISASSVVVDQINIAGCIGIFVIRGSGSKFFDLLKRHDPGDAFHDLFVLFRHLQVVSCLQSHPHFRRAAQKARELKAHGGGKGSSLRQDVVKHLAGDAESIGCRHYGEANRRQNVFLENLTRMNGW
jgi:hypothetical protein